MFGSRLVGRIDPSAGLSNAIGCFRQISSHLPGRREQLAAQRFQRYRRLHICRLNFFGDNSDTLTQRIQLAAKHRHLFGSGFRQAVQFRNMRRRIGLITCKLR